MNGGAIVVTQEIEVENTHCPYENNYLSGQSQSFLKRITVSSQTMKHSKDPRKTISFVSPRSRVKQAPPLKQKNNI